MLAPGPTSAQPDRGVQLDRGVTSIESGQPVPLRNRPLPSRGRLQDRHSGRVVAAAVRDYLEPGEFNGTVGGRAAPAGIYLLRLQAEGVDLSRRLVVTR